jgi:SOS-response transcriptional repressor LexA
MVTPRQRQIYDYLCRYSDAHSYAPTMAEIGKQFKLSSPASVHHILSGLEREGLIRRIPNVSRGIEVVREETADRSDPQPRDRLRAARFSRTRTSVRAARARRFDDRRADPRR